VPSEEEDEEEEEYGWLLNRFTSTATLISGRVVDVKYTAT
jgi:hypothetical protein